MIPIRSLILFSCLTIFTPLLSSCDSSDNESEEITSIEVINSYKMLVTNNNGTTGQSVGAYFFVIEKNTELSIQELGYSQTSITQSGAATTYTYSGGDLLDGTEGALTLNSDASTWTILEPSGRDMSGTYEEVDFE